MIWKNATLIVETVPDTTEESDELGNPICSEKKVASCPARFTPWNNEEIEVEGREVTRNIRKLLLRLPFSVYPVCSRVDFRGESYEITQVEDLAPRFTLLYVKEYKG